MLLVVCRKIDWHHFILVTCTVLTVVYVSVCIADESLGDRVSGWSFIQNWWQEQANMTDDSIETELMTELTTGCGGGEERCRGSERNVNLFFLLWYFFLTHFLILILCWAPETKFAFSCCTLNDNKVCLSLSAGEEVDVKKQRSRKGADGPRGMLGTGPG